MNWKAIVAIVLLSALALGIGVWWGSHQTTDAVMKKDAQRVVEIERLHKVADTHRAKAATLSSELASAHEAVDVARKNTRAAKRRLEAIRRKGAVKTPVTSLEDCKGRLGQCEATTAELDLTIDGLEDMVFAQDTALRLCEERDIERLGQIENCVKAGVIERKRTESWQQQTRRGRVKTAFYGIGMALGGGAAGYAVGRYSN